MQFKTNLIKGKLLKRYKRFLADIILEDETFNTIGHIYIYFWLQRIQVLTSPMPVQWDEILYKLYKYN